MLRRLKNRAVGVFCAPSACASGAGVVSAASGTRSWPVSRTTEKGKRRKMAGVRKAANSHSSLHCCGCSCSLSGHMILWSRTHLQTGIYRTDNEGALLCTVRCSALRAELGSPFGRAKGGACNCAICHNSIKKRSASALMRSVNCLTNALLSFRGVFCYPLSSCSYSSCGRRRPTAENDIRSKSSVSRARPRMSSQVTAS